MAEHKARAQLETVGALVELYQRLVSAPRSKGKRIQHILERPLRSGTEDSNRSFPAARYGYHELRVVHAPKRLCSVAPTDLSSKTEDEQLNARQTKKSRHLDPQFETCSETDKESRQTLPSQRR